MAVVLSSEESNYFSSSALRRSHSQTKFVTKHATFQNSSSTTRINDLYRPGKGFADSAPSSAPSSPSAIQAESTDLSCSSTPASNLSLGSDCDDDEIQLRTVISEDHIFLPQYDDGGFYNQVEELEPPPSPRTGDSYTASPNDLGISTYTSQPETPSFFERAEDDLALRSHPSRHVDYLSHNWREEDIWSSWKHIIARRSDYSNAARLENASWRTWMKAKNNLSTISPETLNWLKDCDVTWLYGPLQTGTKTLDPIHTDMNSARLSKSNSFLNNKKPILKKRSMSEIMLQRSLSSSSLLKQAAAAVQAQQHEGGSRLRSGLERAASDYATFPLASRRGSEGTETLSRFSSISSSGLVSPGGEKKHIHFSEEVAQCIAVDIKGDDDDEDDLDNDRFPYDSDSDDGIMIKIKRSAGRRRRPSIRRPRVPTANNGESKTIAMLPSTTLKYLKDSPVSSECGLKHSLGAFRSPTLSPSSSQETLRPSTKSGKMMICEDEDEDDEDDESDDEAALESSISAIDRRSSSQVGEGSTMSLGSGLHRSASSSSLSSGPPGMRRTPSGMLMPYEEGEGSSPAEGIFGRVIDTVNTARDIAHVIWNVGWRK